MKKQPEITIGQKPDAPIATEILAKAIVDVAAGMKRILNGPLGENTIILLIQDAAGGRGAISQDDVKRVLRSAARLEELYVRKSKKSR